MPSRQAPEETIPRMSAPDDDPTVEPRRTQRRPDTRGGHNHKGERNGQMLADFLAGKRYVEIAAKHGVSVERAREIVRRENQRHAKRALREAAQKTIIIVEGFPLTQDEHGTHCSTVVELVAEIEPLRAQIRKLTNGRESTPT